MKRLTFFLAFLALFLLASDFSLKLYTYHYIPQMSWMNPEYPFGGVSIFKWGPLSFSLNYIQNLGAAWGMFSAYSKTLVVFRILIISALLIFFINRDINRTAPFLLIIAGAIGNILDFFLYGHVIDMFHFRFWGYTPFIFNLADSMITGGLAWLFLANWMHSKKSIQEEKTT